MFDSLLKSKFYSKCKADMKMIKTRIEIIKRKRIAMQKYLRNDIVDLLKNGLDYNAYGRAEGLLVELNLSSCYDIIEQACSCILTHLSAMNKQRECPEECREAVPTLMFAAARFADLPELRALRSLFAERYGNALEPYVNHELVKKSKSTPPTKDMKLQLLQDVALEHGMEWDSKALEQKLYKPPPPPQNEDNNNELQKRSNPSAWRIVNQEVEDRRRNLRNDIAIERDDEHHHPHGRKLVHKYDDDKNNPVAYRISENIPIEGAKVANSDSIDVEKNKGDPEDRSRLNYSSIPPPYTKPKASSTSSPDKEDKPKPVALAKSVRQRRANSSVKKQEGADEKDEEESLMDKLLTFYSKKPSPKLQSDQLEELKQKRKDGVRTRTNSLPGEASTSTTGEEEEDKKKGHVRANSSDHGDPKPLDYDDFMARFAALRGKGKQ